MPGGRGRTRPTAEPLERRLAAVTRLVRAAAACALVSWLVLDPATAPAGVPGRIVIAQAVDPTTLDAMNQAETPTANVVRHLYDTLVERDRDLRLVPALAAELPRAIAPTVWEIRLRRGVRFHDGEEFGAESVK